MIFSLILAFFWGAIWAIYLQFTQFGRFLALKRTWVTVVIGVGVDLLIMIPVMPRRWWGRMLAIIAASSLPIIFRSLWNELTETVRVINVITKGR